MKVRLVRGGEVDLAALDASGMPIGAKVVAADTGSSYTLTVSSAAIDHDATESVLGATSLRWIKDSVPALARSSTKTTAAGNVTSLTVAGLHGDTDGDYLIEGYVAGNGGGNTTFTLQPNGLTANQLTVLFDATVARSAVTSIAVSAAAIPMPTNFYFRVRVNSKTGVYRIFDGSSSDDTKLMSFLGRWLDTATEITSIVLVSATASAIGSGSWLRVTPLGNG